MARDETTGTWDRLKGTGKVVAAIIGTLAALGGAATAGAELFGHANKTIVLEPSATAPPNSGQQIEQCMRRHHLRAARVSVGDPNAAKRITYKRCDWPAIFEGSADGYTEVSADVRTLPKPQAAPYNTVATFRAACDEIDVTFILDQMAARVFSSKRLERGRIYEVESVRGPSTMFRLLHFEPQDVFGIIPVPSAGRGRGFYVLYSGHFAPFDAHCAIGAPPH
ncbi:MAG: hypothetical protein ACJ75G_07380 [Gaiellaceae bacterium]